MARQDSRLVEATDESTICRIDVLGCYFSAIRKVYFVYDETKAQSIIEATIRKNAVPSKSVLYVDGQPSKEKRATSIRRQEIRHKAAGQAALDLFRLEESVSAKQKMRKQAYWTAKKNLDKAFTWSSVAKQRLVEFLRSKGWSVVECEAEADVMIARQTNPGDVVISRDSDMMFYSKVETLWRPLSNNKILVYNIPDVLETLQIHRSQWVALGVVSKNDYTANITSLGMHSNYGIIKNLKGEGSYSMEAAGMLCAYRTRLF